MPVSPEKYQIEKNNLIKNYGYEEVKIINSETKGSYNVHKKILNLLQKDFFKKYVYDEIIKKYLKAYSKFQNNEELQSDEYILKDLEINELQLIEEKNFFRYLIYRYKYNIYPIIYKVDKYPPCVQIEPTSICNFRCIMCYQKDKSFSNKSNGFMHSMNTEMYKLIIDELEGNVEAVTLASRGEPTLNKFLPEMMNYSNNKFLAFKINTNASMLNEKLIHEILSTDFQSIIFSIDSVDKEIYEKIRVNGKFENIISNLELFNKIRRQHYSKSNHIVKCSGVKINNHQKVANMTKELHKFFDVVALVQYTPWESAYDNEINDLQHPCQELWTRMLVWADGKINPCDYDYKSLLSKWNINENSITSVWNSSDYNHYRQLHLNKLRKNIEPCKRCLG